MEFVYELHWISDFRILNQPCLSWVKSTWSYCIIFLMCFWIQFASFCVEFLHLCSSKKWFCNFFLSSFLFLSFFFFVDLHGFGIKMILDEFGSDSFMFYFMKHIEKNWSEVFLESWENLTVNLSGPGQFFKGRLLTSASAPIVSNGSL